MYYPNKKRSFPIWWWRTGAGNFLVSTAFPASLVGQVAKWDVISGWCQRLVKRYINRPNHHQTDVTCLNSHHWPTQDQNGFQSPRTYKLHTTIPWIFNIMILWTLVYQDGNHLMNTIRPIAKHKSRWKQMTYMDSWWVQAIIFMFLMVDTVLKCN